MEPNQPFVCVYFTKHACELHIQGGLFHLHTANGKTEIAAVSLDKGTHQILYQVWPEFIKKYSTLLPLGNVYKWDHKEGLLAWLDSVIYHSFAEGQEQGFPRGWFVKNIPAGNAYELTGIPIGCERFFYQEGKNFWILLKNGTKVWPIRMIKNNFRDNWKNFLKDHEAKTNYKVVFGCYRKWIFDVTVLNTNLERVMQSWNTEDNNLHNLYIPNRIAITSCLPSTMRTDYYHKQFGCVYTTNYNLVKMFEERLNPILRDGELDHIIINSGTHKWRVPVLNGELGQWSFNNFIDSHDLGPTDFIFVGASGHGHLQVIVFARHGGERLYKLC